MSAVQMPKPDSREPLRDVVWSASFICHLRAHLRAETLAQAGYNSRMASRLADLIALLDLESIEKNIFRGQSRDIGTPQVFGGQVLGQALAAASRTVDGRAVHSLHAYFLKRGDVQAPIIYEVDRARDGGTFSNRRVVAIQHGEQIFNMTASFQAAESGLEHQVAMPQVPKPDGLKDLETLAREFAGELPPRMQRFLNWERPFPRAAGGSPAVPVPGQAGPGETAVDEDFRGPAGGFVSAPGTACLYFGLRVDWHRDPAARPARHPREPADGQPRPRHVVPPPGSCGRMAAVCPGQSGRVRAAGGWRGATCSPRTASLSRRSPRKG